MTHKELLSLLLEQHTNLKSILGNVGIELNEEKPDPEKINIFLNDFKIKLREHLELEDGVFYPEVLRILVENKNETKKTENFIAEMKVLGSEVGSFLQKYNNKELIGSNIDTFSSEYKIMTGKILLRVTMEEEGVYMYIA